MVGVLGGVMEALKHVVFYLLIIAAVAISAHAAAGITHAIVPECGFGPCTWQETTTHEWLVLSTESVAAVLLGSVLLVLWHRPIQKRGE